MSLTKKDYKKKLDELGIEYPNDANKTILAEMYEEAMKQNDPDEKELEEELEEEPVEEKPTRSGQASLSDCNRQLQGKRPLACLGE